MGVMNLMFYPKMFITPFASNIDGTWKYGDYLGHWYEKINPADHKHSQDIGEKTMITHMIGIHGFWCGVPSLEESALETFQTFLRSNINLTRIKQTELHFLEMLPENAGWLLVTRDYETGLLFKMPNKTLTPVSKKVMDTLPLSEKRQLFLFPSGGKKVRFFPNQDNKLHFYIA